MHNNEPGILLQGKVKKKVWAGNRELQITWLDQAVVCFMSPLSKEGFLPVFLQLQLSGISLLSSFFFI